MAYLLYETDFNHSTASRVLLGVFTDKKVFIREANKIIKSEASEESKDQIKWLKEFFAEKGQTQGLPKFELYSEKVDTNVIF